MLCALNLLLLGRAEPRHLVLCTFAEKAAFEMRERLAAAARKVVYSGDLSELTVSTIHSLCNRVLRQHRHRTALGHNYETLDELTQLLFIFEHFEQIIGPAENDLFLGRWKTHWPGIEGARGYFDKITGGLVDPERLVGSGGAFLAAIGKAHQAYERALVEANRIDFAQLQRTVFDLLERTVTSEALTRHFKYVLVDEYQDTNYVQERLLLKLTEATHNLCVRGRGARGARPALRRAASPRHSAPRVDRRDRGPPAGRGAGPAPRGRVDVSLEPHGSMARIVVTDTGHGIDADLLPHVFDRFRQGHRTTVHKHGGLGLGLTIVRELVELHGGIVHTESAGKDQGATFTVELPAMTCRARRRTRPAPGRGGTPKSSRIPACSRAFGFSSSTIIPTRSRS